MYALNQTAKLLMLTLFAATLVVSACEDDKQTITTPSSNTNNTNTNNANNAEPDPGAQGEGPDENEEENSTKPGVMQGNWRITLNDADNTPVIKLSLIHDEGAAEATGDYILFDGFDKLVFQGMATPDAAESYHGTTGTDIKATMSGDVFTITFNPTADPEQRFTIKSTSRTGEGQYSAELTSVDQAIKAQVNITLQVFDDAAN